MAKIFIFQVWPQAFNFFCVPLKFMHTPITEIILLYYSGSYMFSHYAGKSPSQGHGSDHYLFICPVTQCRGYKKFFYGMNKFTYKEMNSFFPKLAQTPLPSTNFVRLKTATRKSNRKRKKEEKKQCLTTPCCIKELQRKYFLIFYTNKWSLIHNQLL